MSEIELFKETRHPPTTLLIQLTEKALLGAGQTLVRASVHLANARRQHFARPRRTIDVVALEHRLEQMRLEQARWLPPHPHL